MTYETVLSALADPTRRDILESLRGQKCTVAQIADHQPVSRPAVSQHLKILSDAGLVQVEPSGTRRYYSIKTDGLRELRHYLDSFWSQTLSAFANEIEKQVGENHD